MAIFNEAAGNKTQPINGDYASAAQLIDMGCGPNFVNATVPQGAAGSGTSGAQRFSISWGLAGFAMVAALLVQLLI